MARVRWTLSERGPDLFHLPRERFFLWRTLSTKVLLLKGLSLDFRKASPSSKGVKSGLRPGLQVWKKRITEYTETAREHRECASRVAPQFRVGLRGFLFSRSLLPVYGLEENYYANFLLGGSGSIEDG
jgi:hypothetical protein